VINKEASEDLVLWQGLLDKAHNGNSMNLIVARQPNRLVWSDSCPFRIGGFQLHSSKGWQIQIQIPKNSILYDSDCVNNLLKFIGMAVNVWLEYQDAKAYSHLCILGLGDNTSANSAWLDTKLTAHATHLLVARHVANIALGADCCLASQHIQGKLNFVADLLSFSGSRTRAGGKRHPIVVDDPPDDILTQCFHLYFPDQIPANFAICPLPSQVLSWISSILKTTALSLIADKKGPMRTMTIPGGDGWISAASQASAPTPSLLTYPRSNENYYVELSSPVSNVPNGSPAEKLMESIRTQWSLSLCAKPQATWLWHFGSISNQAPFTLRGEPSCSLSPVPSFKPLTSLTLLPTGSGPSHQNCCKEHFD
jgi:hypothetical protein